MNLPDLITQLESATEGSRELDALIAIALDLRPEWTRSYGILYLGHTDGPCDPEIKVWNVGKRKSRGHPGFSDYLHFSTSVDAALTLIPKGYDASIEIYGNGEADAVILAATGNERGAGWIKAPTVPLAICLAALHSRQSSIEPL